MTLPIKINISSYFEILHIGTKTLVFGINNKMNNIKAKTVSSHPRIGGFCVNNRAKD